MNFYVVYILIPLVLFFIPFGRRNYLLLIYWSVICILSYDNVTDYYNYYAEFVSQDFDSQGFGSKGRELGWIYLVKLFSPWKYGFIMVHAVSMACVIFTFYRYSDKYGILNVSVLLYFILNVVTMHDNTWRQNIAMSIIYLAFPIILEKTNFRNFGIVVAGGVAACFFHYSALLMIPLYFVFRWLAKVEFKFYAVLPIMVILMAFRSIDSVNDIMSNIALLLSLATSSDVLTYYSTHLEEGEAGGMGVSSILLCLSSLVPLLYFRLYNRKLYEDNVLVKFCVNACCFVAIWRTVLNQGLLVRPAEYLMWPYVWGYALFLTDVFKRNKITALVPRVVGVLTIAFFVLFAYQSFTTYYGDNKYLTVFSDECSDLRMYSRYTGEDQNLRSR